MGSRQPLVTGNDLDNVIFANAAGDTIDGGAGNDGIIGGAGNDIIIGSLVGLALCLGGDDNLQAAPATTCCSAAPAMTSWRVATADDSSAAMPCGSIDGRRRNDFLFGAWATTS